LRTAAAAEHCGGCLTQPPPFEQSIAAVDYAPPWDTLLTRYKFQGAVDLAPALADCLARAVRASGTAMPALLLPMPLSERRLRERGYNQAWELARRLGTALHCEADPRLLLRVKDTAHQLALPTAARTANVRGAFAVEPRRLAEVRGREFALVDDVMTTGATAAEAARVLLQAGARRVQVWVVARTPAPAER
jgi:ComF family protein